MKDHPNRYAYIYTLGRNDFKLNASEMHLMVLISETASYSKGRERIRRKKYLGLVGVARDIAKSILAVHEMRKSNIVAINHLGIVITFVRHGIMFPYYLKSLTNKQLAQRNKDLQKVRKLEMFLEDYITNY